MKCPEIIKGVLSGRSFVFLSRIILGITFVYASWDKIMNPLQFAHILYNYRILPAGTIYILSVFLPWLELITGMFLIFGIFTRTSAKILLSLLLIFITAVLINIYRGINFDCGCFSTTETATGSNPYLLLLRDIVLLIPGFAIIRNRKDNKEKK